MSDTKKPESSDQPENKARKMTNTKTPDWIKNAARVDRPEIKRWFKVEDGAIDGTLIWRGRQEHYQTGDTYNAYAIRVNETGEIVGISERAGLRDLRGVKVGSRVFIRAAAVRELENGRKFQQFDIFAEGLEALSDPTKGMGRSGPAQGGVPAASEDTPF
jgi:hypothetical protein